LNALTRKAFEVVEGFGPDKIPIHEARRRFKEAGVIDTTAEAVDQWELEQARGWIGAYRRRCRKAREIQLEFVSLKGTNDKGETIEYYRRIFDMAPEERVQDLKNRAALIRRDQKFFAAYLKVHYKLGGKAKIQRLLPFDPADYLPDPVLP
jgi:hypothetical protein